MSFTKKMKSRLTLHQSLPSKRRQGRRALPSQRPRGPATHVRCWECITVQRSYTVQCSLQEIDRVENIWNSSAPGSRRCCRKTRSPRRPAQAGSQSALQSTTRAIEIFVNQVLLCLQSFQHSDHKFNHFGPEQSCADSQQSWRPSGALKGRTSS